ncbi:MAG TPA: tetratricopeptide repeat protein [Verrucomicrobiae bacterium]
MKARERGDAPKDNTRRRVAGWTLVFFVCFLGTFPALAHDSPEHQVELLNSIIALQGPSASLLSKRATEYRALGQLQKAEADFKAALRLDPKLSYVEKELARIYLLEGKSTQALAAAEHALKLVEEGDSRSSIYLLKAEIQAALGKPEAALVAVNEAFKEGPPDLDAYLQRAQIQGRLGKWDDCIAGLKEGFEQTGSIVLEVEWIEALIDANKCRSALEQIEPHLKNARWKSSWLLRRARARKALGLEFVEDLKAAIVELGERLNPRMPDLTLLADRALAYLLLGKRTEALKDFENAKKLGADEWVLRRVAPLLTAK